MRTKTLGALVAAPFLLALAGCGGSVASVSNPGDGSPPSEGGIAPEAGNDADDEAAAPEAGPVVLDGSLLDALADDAPAPVDGSTPDATIQDSGPDATDSTDADASPADSNADTSAPDGASAPDASVGDAAPPPDANTPDDAGPSIPCVIPADAWTATVASPPLPPEIAPVADSVLTVALPANDLLYDPYTQLLYASIPGSFGASGDSIARIDPTTGTVVGTVYVGSEPGPLAESADGQFIYVGLNGANAVRRYVLATQTPDLQFSFAETGAAYDVAVSLAVLPTSPHSVLVGSGAGASSWVGVYDDGVIRGAPLAETDDIVSTGSDALALAPPSEYPSGITHVLCIDSMGAHLASSIMAAISNDQESVPYYQYVSGILYSESGAALDVVSGLLAGTYGRGGALAVEPRVDRAFFLNGPQIVSYTLDHFTPAGSVSLTPPLDEASRLVRWGRYGFAFLSGPFGAATQIAVVRTSLVPVGP